MPATTCQLHSKYFLQNKGSNYSLATTLLNVNVPSLPSNFDPLELFVNNVVKPFDVRCLTKTLLYEDEINNYSLNGYHFVGK